MTTPVVRFRLDFGRDEAVGPGKIALLEHIASGGSLSQAARELNMSYRRAWQLLASVNGSFREPAVRTQKGGRGGGGAELTAFGRELIDAYREFEVQVQTLAARSFRPLAAKRASRARAALPVRRLHER